jgi:hypothetical protein
MLADRTAISIAKSETSHGKAPSRVGPGWCRCIPRPGPPPRRAAPSSCRGCGAGCEIRRSSPCWLDGPADPSHPCLLVLVCDVARIWATRRRVWTYPGRLATDSRSCPEHAHVLLSTVSGYG